MQFVAQPPPARLRAMVREFWFLDDDGSMSAGLPKPQVELVISLSGVHWWRASPDGMEYCYREAWLTPLQYAPRYARADGRRRLIGARLEPWAAAGLFGRLPVGNGRPPPHLASLIGREAARLRRRICAVPDLAGRFAILGDWLEGQSTPGAPARRLPEEELSRRSLRRLYAREIGLSPKRCQMLHRLDGVLRDPFLSDRSRSLALVAHLHGFADQPHFSREIVRLMGATAGTLRARPAGCPPHLLRQG